MERRLDEGKPSATAWGVAVRRAAHQLIDHPRVFDDPLAVTIVGDARVRAGLARERTPWGRALRAHVCARSRFAEDRLTEARARGVRQYVVLGAGLDTYGCRNPRAELDVFEVDHPATQAWKRKLLAAAGVDPPSTLTFAPVDFETQNLDEGLAAAGFAFDQPTMVSWLGVIMYLTEDAAFQTLGQVAAWPAGTEIVFDFPVTADLLSVPARLAARLLARRVAAAGEPFRAAYAPEDLKRRLLQTGFSRVDILGPDELNARYFSGRGDGLRLHGSGRLACARV